MQSAVLCHAAVDSDPASKLVGYLELNCPQIRFDTEEFAAPGGILDAAERALSADFPILLLSPAAVPQPWPRAAWEPILVDEARRFERQIAYVLVQECKFPDVLRRGVFFDLSNNRLAGHRALKRWLLHSESASELPEPDASAAADPAALETLTCRISDQPATATDVNRGLALAFAHARAADFERALWLNCAHRSPAGIAGDAAHGLELRLPGMLEENADALREFCAARRILLVFEHAAPEDAEWAAPDGKASFLFVAKQTPPPPRSLAQTMAHFASWRKDPGPCFRALGDAQAHVRRLPDYADEEWRTALSLSQAAASLLQQTGRLAEAYEFLETAIAALRARGYRSKVAELEAEKSWILEAWGFATPAPRRPQPASPAVQLGLFG